MKALTTILLQFGQTLKRLGWAVQRREDFEGLLAKYGYDVTINEEIWPDLQNLPTLWDEINATTDLLESMLSGSFETVDQLEQLYELAQQLRKVILSLLELQEPALDFSPFDQGDFWPNLGNRLLNDLLVYWLEEFYPLLFSYAKLVGVIEEVSYPTENDRNAYEQQVLYWDRFGLISNQLRQIYSWNDTTEGRAFLWEKLLQVLEDIVDRLGFKSRFFFPVEMDFGEWKLSDEFIDQHNVTGIQVPYIHGEEDDDGEMDEGFFFNLGVGIIPVRESQQIDLPNALLLLPILQGRLSHRIPLGSDLELVVNGQTDLDKTIGVLLGSEGLRILKNVAESDFTMGISLVGKPDKGWILLGGPDTHRLQINGFDFGISYKRTDETNDELTFTISTLPGETEAYGVEVILAVEESDSFLQSILPEDGVEVGLNLAYCWSNINGSSSNFDFSLSHEFIINKSLGGISIDRLGLALRNSENASSVYTNSAWILGTSLDVRGDLGPVKFVVEDMGFKVDFIPYSHEDLRNLPPEADPPLLGLLDLDFGFAPPRGLGFTVDTDLVQGGGYLEFHPDKGEYIGAAELTVMDEFSVKAIGIINTQLPDGQEGYSFLLLITAEFDPVQLGFGFTLSGVGGMIGLHRSLDLEVIQDKVKTDDFNTILFPQDPINNIQTIITSLNGIFPITEDHYSFGIMGELGWGTPTLVKIKMGLLFQIPGGRIALVGLAKTEITRTKASEDEDEEDVKVTLLRLQVNFAATYRPAAALVTFDASLYQSKILGLDLKGDVAIRLRGGSDPFLLISIGGFHPDFVVPEGLYLDRKLDRISLTILDDNPLVKAEFFFALTSNTVQFGAEAVAKYDGWGFSVDGGLGFDALIQFSPLHFLVRVWGWMTVYAFGGSFGVRLQGEVEGPYPLHFALTVTIDLWICDVSFSFNFEKGTSALPESPSVELLPILMEALNDINSWQADRSERIHLLVSTRRVEEEIPEEGSAPADQPLAVHPVGTIGIRQDIMPTGIRIDKFGDNQPSDFSHLLLRISDQDGNWLDDLKQYEYFAPAQYFDLNDEEKLNRKSYEKMPGGIIVSGLELTQVGHILEKSVTYESKTIDPDRPEELEIDHPEVKPGGLAFQAWAANSVTANSGLGRKQEHRMQSRTEAVRLQREEFAIVRGDNLAVFDQKRAGSEAEAYHLLKDILRKQPDLEDQLTVVPLFETLEI